MTQAAAAFLGERLTGGIATGTRGGGSLPPSVDWTEGAHPLPDEGSVRAARRAIGVAARAGEERGLLLALLSGGGSSMLALPADGITLDDKKRTIEVLSRAGVPIAELNCVRKHLSAIKGGRLAAAANGACLTLAVSDVHRPEDDAATIASGPTVGDPTTFEDALRVIDAAGGRVPPGVRAHLERGAAGEIGETPEAADPRLRASTFHVIANRHTAMDGAVREAKQRGYRVRVVDPAVQGEASAAGRAFAEDALAASGPGERGCVIASGETTVAVRGGGRGGRNQEFVLGAAMALAKRGHLTVVSSAGTDGIDGPTDAAGGVVTSATVADAYDKGVDMEAALASNDAYPALDTLGALIRWGPTLTNVGDVHVLLTMKL